jgi:transcriptional regulator with XRE-family HTH domain
MSNIKLSIEQNNIGAQLRRARKERGLTLEQLQEILKISYGYIGQIERGARQPEPLVREKIEQWIEQGANVQPFTVTSVIEAKKNAEYNSIMEEIFSVTGKLSRKGQGEALEFMVKLFIDEQTSKKD